MKGHCFLKCLGVGLLLLALLAPKAVHAQQSDEANSRAVALFQEARVLMANGKFRTACPKLEASLGIEWGMGTLYNLADCYEGMGWAASAWVGFRDVLVTATILGQKERAQAARNRLAAVEPKRSKLRVLVAPEAATSGIRVQLDGMDMSPVVWGMEVPLNPGSYQVTASAPGRVEWKAPVEIKEPGKVSTVRVPVLEPASAQDATRDGNVASPAPVTAEDTKAAWFFDDGVTAADAGQWTKARKSLLSAWRIRQDWRIAAELGRAALMSGKPLDGVKHLTEYLRRASASVSSLERQNARALLDAVRSTLGVLTIKASPRGAELLVDGEAVGHAPLAQPILVEPGRRTIEVRMEGRAPEQLTVDVVPGLKRDIALVLSLPRSGGDAAPTVDDRAERKPGWWKPWGIGAATGLATVGLGLGIGFTLASNNSSNDAEAELSRLRQEKIGWVCEIRSDCTVLQEQQEAMDTARTVAVASYVLGGVAAVGAVVVAFWPVRESATTSVRAVPSVMPGFGGVVLMGKF